MKALKTAPVLATGIYLTVLSSAWACFCCVPPRYYPIKYPVQVAVSNISVDINEQVARWTHEVTFFNPNDHLIEGATAYLELEAGAQVDDMSVLVGGQEIRGEILGAEKAKEIFHDLLAKGGSPALLDYYGNQLIQANLPRVPAGGTVIVKVKYTSVLKKQANQIRLQCLNIKDNPKPLKNARVTVNISSQIPITNVYSPTHKIKLVETEKADISAQWLAKDYRAKTPFVLYYQLADSPIAASLLAHRELDEDGHFMLRLSPTVGQGEKTFGPDDVLPKDVVFCIDTSGSMLQGQAVTKMDQAREALIYCLKQLRPGDRFNVVDFSTSARSFSSEKLLPATKDKIQAAIDYAEELKARGGTAIQAALESSLAKLQEEDGRLKMILFATDGLPTIGERNPDGILRRVAKRNTNGVRLFVFGEGYDVNAKLLDFLALNNQGETDYVLPDEDIAKKIGSFFDRVGSPLLTDLQVEIEGVEVAQVQPRRLGDLFQGEQLMLFGQYSGDGPAVLRLTGKSGEKTRTLEFELDFPELSETNDHSFVPRLWAGRRVDFLLNELRKGEDSNDELVNEVTYLAKRYGIVTPYTSFLMAEDVVGAPVPPVVAQPGDPVAIRPLNGFARLEDQRNRDRLKQALAQEKAQPDGTEGVLKSVARAASRKDAQGSGGAAALDEAAARSLVVRGAGQPATPPAGRLGLSRKPHAALGAKELRQRTQELDRAGLPLRYIANRTFYRSGGIWYQSEFPAKKETKVSEVALGSPEFLKLLQDHPRLAPYLSLGQVVLQVGDDWVRVTPAKAQ